MKKNVCIAVCLAATLALLATACHDVIFYEIRQEVELTDGQVPGDIRSIVEFGNYLYVENGNIYRKDKTASSYGQWVKLSRDGMGGGKVIKLATDSSNLYALVARVESDEDEGENYVAEQMLYASTDGDNWTKVDVSLPRTGNHLYSLENVAYIKTYDGTGYVLSGTTSPSASEIPNYVIMATSADGVTYTASNRTISQNGTSFYNVGSSIYSMALTSDCIVVGTASGLKYIDINSRNETTVANSASALSSYYEVHCVFVVNSGKNTARNSDIYASAIFSGTTSSGASSDNEGLWAYYPGRGSWNRE